MFSFSIESARAMIARGRADAEANSGYLNPRYSLYPGSDKQPGVCLMDDHGVYLCLNGKLPDGERPFVADALECDPRTNEDWFEVKRKTFGGNDSVEFIDAVKLEAIIAATPDARHLDITVDADSTETFNVE